MLSADVPAEASLVLFPAGEAAGGALGAGVPVAADFAAGGLAAHVGVAGG